VRALAEDSASPATALADPAGTTVSRTAPLDDGRVRTEILTQAPLGTLLAGFACSLVVAGWIDRPPTPTGGGG
jgi:hypothetical protein